MNRRDILRILPLSAAVVLPPERPLAETAAEQPPKLSLQYLREVRSILRKIQSTEMDNLLEASRHIARTYRNGGKCYTTWDVGHSLIEDMYPDRPGDAEIFTAGYPEEQAKPGDLLLGGIIAKVIEDPRKKGVFLIGSPVPWCGDTPDAHLLSEQHRQYRIRPYSDLWIETYSTTWGPIIWLPGAEYPMGAVSSAIGMATWWAMIADAVRLLAADGVYVKVKGDEPKLADTARYVRLTSPLGEDYFTELLHQLEL
ncbi:MAG: phosphoheptose isomerase family protein, partial [Candidatus Latescibacterota bacterium]